MCLNHIVNTKNAKLFVSPKYYHVQNLHPYMDRVKCVFVKGGGASSPQHLYMNPL